MYSKTSTSAVAVGDIDGDKDLEIVIAANAFLAIPALESHGVQHNGNYARGWPKTVEPTRSSPAIGDIDGDGRNEIVVPVSSGKVYAWRGSAELLPGWPVMRSETSWITSTSPELPWPISMETETWRFLWARTSRMAPSMPGTTMDPSSGVAGSCLQHRFFRTPWSGTLTRMERPEIISALVLSGGDSCYIYVWKMDGSPVPGWPKHLYARRRGGLADIDGDGDLEIFASTRCTTTPSRHSITQALFKPGITMGRLSGDGRDDLRCAGHGHTSHR